MKQQCVLLVLGLVALCALGAPVEQEGGGVEQGSCQDAQALGAAGLALTEINKDRQEGFILSLYRMANVNMMKHGETGVVFYLTLDVVETSCPVISRKDWKKCEARTDAQTPVYGQCKASIFISKVHRVVRLYKYDCTIRPVPAEKLIEVCPDCPSHTAKDGEMVLSTASKSLEKYNKESGLANRFAMLNVTRATASDGMATFYNVEYTIQETSCANSAETKTEDCPIMSCEFAHKGYCKGTFARHPGGEDTSVECEIYEPEAAEKEKKLHLLGEKTDHSHTDAHTEGGVDATHDDAHDATQGSHPHDHAHDHTKSHTQHDATGEHAEGSEHHHTHDHDGVTHSHAHSHDHGHGHDHVHTHHAKAHDHSGDTANTHHRYHGANGAHTHEHDHEMALDHDHKHAHLHEHEHHHHHHEHTHEPHRHPEGQVRVLPALGQPITLPSFPDQPVGGPEEGVTLPLVPDPDIPGQREPTILAAFPTAVASDCPALVPPKVGVDLVAKMFAEDPEFKTAA